VTPADDKPGSTSSRSVPVGRRRSQISGGTLGKQWVGRGRGGNPSHPSSEPRKQRKPFGVPEGDGGRQDAGGESPEEYGEDREDED
jgi:hypothetical protein